MAGKAVVESLYAAVARGDTAGVAAVMAEDVEWWFHGPRRCQYMRRLLTGEAGQRDFRFRPRTVTAISGGRWVVAEGWEGKHAYWIHVWAVDAAVDADAAAVDADAAAVDADAAVGGCAVITRFREYFNTALTVHQFGAGPGAVWQSKARGPVAGRSLPELVLAI